MDTRVYEYGNPDSSTVLLQMVDDHDLAVIENEVAAIRKTADDFRLFAIKVKNWNLDLSPWNAPAVFGRCRCLHHDMPVFTATRHTHVTGLAVGR